MANITGVRSGERNQSSQPQMYPEFSTLRKLSCGPLKDNPSSHSRKMAEFSASKLGGRSFFKYSHVQFENGKCVIGSVSNLLVYYHRSLAAHFEPSAVFPKNQDKIIRSVEKNSVGNWEGIEVIRFAGCKITFPNPAFRKIDRLFLDRISWRETVQRSAGLPQIWFCGAGPQKYSAKPPHEP